jgi:hypothetical protein
MLTVSALAIGAQVAAWIVAGLMACLFVWYDYRRRVDDLDEDDLDG